MASLCNYSHPDPQIAQGLVPHGAGKLFPYNPEFYDNASGLYGPGTIYCWYMLLVSVVASWSFHQADHGSLKDPGLSSDLIGALAYPVFAATDLLVQSIRMRGMDHRAIAILCLRYPKHELDAYGPFDNVEIDLHHIPLDLLNFGQHIVDITGPLTIRYTATSFLFLLYILFCSSMDLGGTRYWKPIPAVRWVMYTVYGYILLILAVFHLSLDNWFASFFLFYMETTLPAEIIMAYVSTFTITIALICFLAMLVWAVIGKDRGQAIEALKAIGCVLYFMILLAMPSMMVLRWNELGAMPDLGIRVSERDQLATLIVGVFTLSLTFFDIGHHFYRKMNGREVTEESIEMLPASEV
ncbi:Ff.00g111930.m01.CDS01 [Fusarium sp. VM40]|nr:Ff.00g111930.m01.CDS01 [Fusarium sp. VM40]